MALQAIRLLAGAGQARVVYGAISPQQASRALAQSNEGLLPHTDGYYHNLPPDFVVMGVVRPADSGGETTLVTADSLVDRLDSHDMSLLEAPIWCWPTLGTGGEWTPPRPVMDRAHQCIRWWPYDALIRSDEMRAVADRVRRATVSPSVQREPLSKGTLILIDNRRVMHGRTAFTGANRLLLVWRVFLESPSAVLQSP